MEALGHLDCLMVPLQAMSLEPMSMLALSPPMLGMSPTTGQLLQEEDFLPREHLEDSEDKAELQQGQGKQDQGLLQTVSIA